MVLCGFPEPEQGHKERLLPTTTHHGLIRCTTEGQDIHQNQPPTQIPPCPDCQRRQVENGVLDPLRLFQMVGHAIWVDQQTCGFSTVMSMDANPNTYPIIIPPASNTFHFCHHPQPHHSQPYHAQSIIYHPSFVINGNSQY